MWGRRSVWSTRTSCTESCRIVLLMRLSWVAICAVGVGALHAQKVDFQREIRPVLSDNCFQCHGPDAGTRMAGLRLDLKDGLLGSGVIVAGKPAESKLYQRISA